MGPIVPDDQSRDLRSFLLRPFRTSTTFRNLEATRIGVLHLTDEASLFVDCVLNITSPQVPLVSETIRSDQGDVHVSRLADCCRWFAFRVTTWRTDDLKAYADCTVIASGEVRPFSGFNRAKHACLEAAILASRVDLLPEEDIRQEMNRLSVPVDKTAHPGDRAAFDRIKTFLEQRWSERKPAG